MPGTLIATQGDENWVLSPDGAYIYVAGSDGNLRVFDSHSGQLMHSVDLGADLGAISLSPDGTRLAVVEEVPENIQQGSGWTTNTADISLYIVDLSTFGAQELTFRVTAESYTFADVTWSDNDTLQLSQNITPGWSGWAPLATVELATGVMTEHSSYYSGLGTSASLLTIPGSTTVLLGQLGLSSAEYFLIGPDGNRIGNNGGSYANNMSGYAGGIEAASGTTPNDRIIMVTGGDAHLFDGTLAYIGNIADIYPHLGNAAGVTFSADGQRIFFLDATNKAVVVVDAYNYSLVATVPLTGVVFETLKWGEEIVVAPDGNGVYYNTSTGISYAPVDLPDLGTDGADQLSGTAGDDILDGRAGADSISGLAGDDWLIGGLGNDLLDGGDGIDVASYETATTGVTVSLEITGAQATVGADSDTLVRIEGLSGSLFNDTLTGNAAANLLLGYDGNDTLYGLAGDDDLYGEIGNDQLFGGAGVDWLFGGSGADLLDGGTGADRLEGGDGNDTYVVDDIGDVVLETATGGYDTMQVSNISATIASSVEALVILNGAVNATGDFVANSLTGSDQANVLSGLGGNDILSGGGGNDTLVGGSGTDTLTGGSGADIFRDTASGLNGDTITDLQAGDSILITDADAAAFDYSLSGSTLTFTGGSLTLHGTIGLLVASAAAGGGVQLLFEAPPPRATNDFNGDGRSDVLWRNSSGALVEWLGQADGTFANNASVVYQLSTDYEIVATGDFNGDNRSDILWRHSSGNTMEWTAQSNGSFAFNAAGSGSLGLDWHVTGTADFNGDNRDDVLWRSETGVVTNWVAQSDGSFVASAATYAMPTDWTLAAAADFTGDNRGDVLWRHDSGVVIQWVGQADGSFAWDSNVSYALPTDWDLAAAGDFNGDDRTDLIWRHSSGDMIEWLGQSNGSFAHNVSANSSLATSWHVAGVGDFNGDGNDDLIWRSDDGAMTIWRGQDNGSFLASAAVYQMPTDWAVQPESQWL